MSARFYTNFLVLMLGAALLVVLFAMGRTTADWVAVGAGSCAVVLALYSFACSEQGVYQRLADVAIATLGGWAIVAARVMDSRGVWLVFGAGLGLVGCGALGLVVRELQLGNGLQVGGSRIGPDEFARLSTLQRSAKARG